MGAGAGAAQMPTLRGIKRGPGAWEPSADHSVSARFDKRGPDNLDVMCKATLHKLLRPSHYGAVQPLLQHSGTAEKEQFVQLGKFASTADKAQQPVYGVFSVAAKSA